MDCTLLCTRGGLSIVIYLLGFFHDTATTEVYTYYHTLSLHAALPIYAAGSASRIVSPDRSRGAAPDRARPNDFDDDNDRDVRRPAPRRAGRSEEHTSELQSLMRNSYAVFCL